MQENQPPVPLSYAKPEKSGRGKHSFVRWLLFGSFVFVAVVTLLLPSLGRPREMAKRIRCASNLKLIGLSIQLYANTNADFCPPTLDEVLASDDLTTEVFTCPSTSDIPATGPTTHTTIQDFHNPGRCSYVYVLAPGTKLSSLSPQHVIAYEPISNHPIRDSATTKGMNVLYADGSAEWLNERKAKHMTAELQAGHNPPRPISATAPLFP